MKILAIETSCDETAAAVVEKLDSGLVRVLGESIASSQETHRKTGGIVPEVAAREQLQSIIPVINNCLDQARQTLQQHTAGPKESVLSVWAKENISAIAVTQGPGLIGSLLVGVETAKTLALAWKKPLFAINHLLGHIYGNWLVSKIPGNSEKTPPAFPAVALIVSGGHSELILMNSHTQYTILGATRDDAAGECFDKCARLLGFSYPGGPAISRLSAQYDQSDDHKPFLPRPLMYEDSYDFSFSGLKAAFAREHQRLGGDNISQAQACKLAYELEVAISQVIVKKVLKAIETVQPKSFLLAGGVAANALLRSQLLENLADKVAVFIPDLPYCSDNAAMIGSAGLFAIEPTPLCNVSAHPGLELIKQPTFDRIDEIH